MPGTKKGARHDRRDANHGANARRTFDDLKRKGFAAFAVGAKGEKTTQIREFDPAAEKIIMVPALAGGGDGGLR